MKKKQIIITIAALFFFAVTASSGFSGETKGHGDEKSTAQSSQQNTESSTSQAMNHDSIDSGRDFGQHVSQMNDHFSGDHNPGVNHQGYSGIKDK